MDKESRETLTTLLIGVFKQGPQIRKTIKLTKIPRGYYSRANLKKVNGVDKAFSYSKTEISTLVRSTLEKQTDKEYLAARIKK